jgi:hypothetical protein
MRHGQIQWPNDSVIQFNFLHADLAETIARVLNRRLRPAGMWRRNYAGSGVASANPWPFVMTLAT